MGFEEYEEVTTESWLSRLGNSIVGVFLGILLFFASFIILFWNEGRTDLSQVAKGAIALDESQPNASAQGKLISLTGTMVTPETLGDNFFLQSDRYLAFWREVEMFAWKETTITEKEKNVGGSETTKTTYRYTTQWQNNPERSSSFRFPQGHYNPPLAIEDQQAIVQKMTMGIYNVSSDRLRLPKPSQPLPLNQNSIRLNNQATIHGNYIFQGEGTFVNPEVGDIRLQYYVLPSGTKMTVFGKLAASNRIVPYQNKRGTQFYQGFLGSREAAIAQLKNTHTFSTWLLRGGGFLIMWMGLNLAVAPIAVLLDFLPFLGDLFRGLSGAASFLVALILSSVTIIVSILVHNLIALIIAVVVTVIVIASGRYILRQFR